MFKVVEYQENIAFPKVRGNAFTNPFTRGFTHAKRSGYASWNEGWIAHDAQIDEDHPVGKGA